MTCNLGRILVIVRYRRAARPSTIISTLPSAGLGALPALQITNTPLAINRLRGVQRRCRPILMTTLAALFAGIPLVIASGPGTELRRPLGITIIGGLFVPQILTLYTTAVIPIS
jgi:multidrug efflux pump